MENLKTALEEMFKMDRQLLGAGFDNALKYLDHLIGLEVLEYPSGTEVGTWTIPEEWVVKDAYVKYKGKKIIDYKENPLSLLVYSLPFKGIVTRDELLKHLHWSDENPDATPYVFKFYDRDWGFAVHKNKVKVIEVSDCEDCEPTLKAFDPEVGKVHIEGDKKEVVKDRLEEGEYEVFIDTEFRLSKLKIGVHTIKGTTDREILLLAHLDHPYQANDNLSGVVCLLDLAKRLKCEHTIKIIFCPETIGSQAYAYQEDLSKVDFVISLDSVGNNNSILLQKSFDEGRRLNWVAHAALQMGAKSYRKGKFRTSIGSDETVFNDPSLNIPGLLITRFPFDQYHTNWDTPDKINYPMILETGDLVQKIIEIYERDYIPVRTFKGPLMRSRYGLQSPVPRVNLVRDYFYYLMDGKKSLSYLCMDSEMPFDLMYEELEKLVKDGFITKIPL